MMMGATKMKRITAAMLIVMAMGQVLAADEVLSVTAVPKHLELARELVATVKPENNKYIDRKQDKICQYQP